MNHTAAFQCAACPRNNDPKAGPSCPAWWEWASENVGTGEARIEKMCGLTAAPIFLTEVIKASNRPAAAIESTRNEIAQGFSKVVPAIAARVAPLLATLAAAPVNHTLPGLPPLDALPAGEDPSR